MPRKITTLAAASNLLIETAPAGWYVHVTHELDSRISHGERIIGEKYAVTLSHYDVGRLYERFESHTLDQCVRMAISAIPRLRREQAAAATKASEPAPQKKLTHRPKAIEHKPKRLTFAGEL